MALSGRRLRRSFVFTQRRTRNASDPVPSRERRATCELLSARSAIASSFSAFPPNLGVPAKVEVASPVERAAEEPLRLSRDATDGFQFLRVTHEAHHSIVEVLGEHIGPLNDVTLQQISHEFGEALETCHPRTLLDLGNFVPPSQASVFVTVLIKLKKRWLEKHTVPGDPVGDGSKGAAQPTVKQLSFPVFKARATGLKTLEAIADGSGELALCGVPNALVDVLKVTRLLRAPPI